VDAPPRTIGELLSRLNRLAPSSRAAGWDPVGLQVGDPEAPAGTVAVCHEVTEDLLAVVESDPPALLVTYHPLLFRPTTALVAGGTPAGRAWRLARAGVALAVFHTNWDVAPGGAAEALAAELGLTHPEPFAPVDAAETVKVVTFCPEDAADQLVAAMSAAGAGEIGSYTSCSFRSPGVGSFFAGVGTTPVTGSAGALNREPEVRVEMVAPASRRHQVVAALVAAHPYEEPAYDVVATRSNLGFAGRIGETEEATLDALARLVAARLGVAGLRVGGELKNEVDRVAVIPGSGGDLVAAARRAGADVLVTGDVRHHEMVGALDAGLAVIDPGHTATERPGVRALYAAVRSVVAGTVDLTHLDPIPWRDVPR
jgi:dinuclear metal center YbgI/SA1388 family protein